MKNFVLFTDAFNERILLKRTYIDKSYSKESVVLLCELLNQSLFEKRKELSSNSLANIKYSIYNYRNGYVLDALLSMAEVKNVSYIFKNPYNSAFKILDDFSSDIILNDEKSLAIAKESIISKYFNSLNYKTLDKVNSFKNIDFSTIIIDKRKLQNVLIEDVNNALIGFRDSEIGDYIYIGTKTKNDPFMEQSFKNNLVSLQESDILKEDLLLASEKEGMYINLDLSNVTNYETYLKNRNALFALENYLESKLSKIFGSKVYFTSDIISSNRAYIYLEVNKGRINILKEQVLSLMNNKFDLEENMFNESLIKFNKMQIEKSIYSSIAVDMYKKLISFNINDINDYFTLKTFSFEDIKNEINKIKFNSYTLVADRKD